MLIAGKFDGFWRRVYDFSVTSHFKRLLLLVNTRKPVLEFIENYKQKFKPA